LGEYSELPKKGKSEYKKNERRRKEKSPSVKERGGKDRSLFLNAWEGKILQTEGPRGK